MKSISSIRRTARIQTDDSLSWALIEQRWQDFALNFRMAGDPPAMPSELPKKR